jgi:hypothetical protein
MSKRDQLTERRQAYILLRVQLAVGRRLKQSDLASKFNKTVLRALDLGHFVTKKGNEEYVLDRPRLNALRDELVNEGYLKRSWEKRTAYLQTTEKGQALLFASHQYESIAFNITGGELNRLFADARETLLSLKDSPQSREELPASANAGSTGDGKPPAPEIDLAAEVMAEFEQLLQEQPNDVEMIPIHLVRRRIAQRLGEAAAAHDVFDPVIQQLGKQRRLRLVAISDYRDATQDELEASVPGVNETLFYLKPTHEPARL